MRWLRMVGQDLQIHHGLIMLYLLRRKTTRFVVDYRKLNDVTVKDAYPMPNIREILYKMHKSVFFSKMDMASAYWAVPIKEEDSENSIYDSAKFIRNVLQHTAFVIVNLLTRI